MHTTMWMYLMPISVVSKLTQNWFNYYMDWILVSPPAPGNSYVESVAIFGDGAPK